LCVLAEGFQALEEVIRSFHPTDFVVCHNKFFKKFSSAIKFIVVDCWTKIGILISEMAENLLPLEGCPSFFTSLLLFLACRNFSRSILIFLCVAYGHKIRIWPKKVYTER
jgi:hypothetical protein